MKKIFKFIMPCMALACMVMTSCYDTMDDKAEVEAGWGQYEAPTVTLNSVEIVSFNQAKLNTTLSAMKYTEVGAVVATKADLSDAAYQPAKIADDATIVEIPVTKLAINTTYYVAAYAVNLAGERTISEVKQIQTPDVPLTVDMICGNYSTTGVQDYFDNVYDFNFTIEEDAENPGQLIIKNLDPFFVSNGFTADKGVNTFVAEYDLDKKEIVIPAGQPVGYKTFVIMGWDGPDPDIAEDYDDIYVGIEDYGETLVFKNSWGITGWYTLFYGDFKVTKK